MKASVQAMRVVFSQPHNTDQHDDHVGASVLTRVLEPCRQVVESFSPEHLH
jgi:hypothetical protein